MADHIITTPITSMKGAFSVEGFNVVVTGGNRGIGRGITQAFAECGANVAILCRNVESAQAVCEELAPLGGTYLAVKCDVGSYDDILAAKEEVAKTFDHIDCLVNNAGIDAHLSIFDDDHLEEFTRVMNVNLNGPTACSAIFGKWMMDERRGGSIIMISSIGGEGTGNPRINPMPSYNTSKAALNHLTHHLAILMGDYGIRVNTIAPGLTHSGLDADLPPIVADWVDNEMPAHRFGEPIEVGALCVFLASPAAAQMTGDVIRHDGGIMTLGLSF